MKHERILTTLAKAKALRRLADWTITQGKVNTVASHVRANGFVREHPVTKKVFLDLAQRYKYVIVPLHSLIDLSKGIPETTSISFPLTLFLFHFRFSSYPLSSLSFPIPFPSN